MVVPNNRAQNSAEKNLLSTEKITTLEQRTRDVARGLYFIETQGAYEIRLGHMSTWPCKSARRFANLQTALHINKGLLHICRGLCTQYSGPMHMCKAACLFARPFADMQRRAFMCSSACLCARPSVYLQAAMHVCTTPCLFAARPACMHGAVFIRKRPCICAERHACLQTSVHVCRAACLFARPHARVHASPDHFQRKLNLRDDVWVEVTSQHGLLPETHPGIF